MLNRFKCGTIVERVTAYPILNDQLYVVDPNTQKIRVAENMDEWLTCQVVLVDDYRYNAHIPQDIKVRCWIVYIVT